MKIHFGLNIAGLLAAALLALPSPVRSQTTNTPPAEKKATSETPKHSKHSKTPGAGPFHGKLASLDKVAKTITVGKRTFQITSQTKIQKDGKPATLADGVVGENVSGYIKPGSDGKLVASTVNFGAKPAARAAKKSTSQPEQK
ncbi:MAG: hypothetical protein ACREIC_17230 [Limisphaerales bacterium]